MKRFLIATLFLVPPAALADPIPLPGTQPLKWPEAGGALADRLMDGAHAFVERKIGESRDRRARHWNYDSSSPKAYQHSIRPNRDRFKKLIGVVDSRVSPVTMERFGTAENPPLVARTKTFEILQVRWSVLDGVTSEGLLFEPGTRSDSFLISVPDADRTPEQHIALTADSVRPPFPADINVIVPALVDRRPYLGPSGDDPRLKRSQQSHREWIYRQAFHMGRHIIGYEVQKILAAVDWIHSQSPNPHITVSGSGEGSLLAFYAAACDPRIDSVSIDGYFGPRESVWSEPIERNLFGLLTEFGDAEIASLIAPRPLWVWAADHPDAENKGAIPDYDETRARRESTRLHADAQPRFQFDDDPSSPTEIPLLVNNRRDSSASARHDRLFRQLESHVQSLVRASNTVRQDFFFYQAEPRLRPGKWTTSKDHPTLDPETFVANTRNFRRTFHRDLMGQFDEPLLPPNPRTRRILETEDWTAYDVVLDVYPEFFAWGVLLLPKNLARDERRPVVVCQHGRQGLPRDTVDANNPAYNDFAAKLAERGFITFAPHNLYRGEDRYRWLDRKANSIGCTLFSFIIPSHRQILGWLKTLPSVDPDRIAFYGLSYGGETAVRVPAVLEDYCLSICSGDFNQWTRKVAATDFPNGFMKTIEWEMPYWNLGHTFDYAEMAGLIFPRPFMVERGHHDRVSVDHWVAHEYAKVRHLYAQFGLAGKTEIEFFQGGHSINGSATFDFLHKHLDWPQPPKSPN